MKFKNWVARKGLWTRRCLASPNQATRAAAISFLVRSMKAGTLTDVRIAKYDPKDIGKAAQRLMDDGVFNSYVMKNVPWRDIVAHPSATDGAKEVVLEQAVIQLQSPERKSNSRQQFEEELLAILTQPPQLSKRAFDRVIWKVRSASFWLNVLSQAPHISGKQLEYVIRNVSEGCAWLKPKAFNEFVNSPKLTPEQREKAFINRCSGDLTSEHLEIFGHPLIPARAIARIINLKAYCYVMTIDCTAAEFTLDGISIQIPLRQSPYKIRHLDRGGTMTATEKVIPSLSALRRLLSYVPADRLPEVLPLLNSDLQAAYNSNREIEVDGLD